MFSFALHYPAVKRKAFAIINAGGRRLLAKKDPTGRWRRKIAGQSRRDAYEGLPTRSKRLLPPLSRENFVGPIDYVAPKTVQAARRGYPFARRALG